MRRVLAIPDCHIPFHDRRAYELMLKVARDFDPHEIVVLGDFADFYSVSTFSKSPTALNRVQVEVESVSEELRRLEAIFPRAKRIFISGNHEFRLERYLQDRAPELYGVIDLDRLFELTKNGWKLLAYGRHHAIGKLLFAHGDVVAADVARRMARKYGRSVCFGHVHRITQEVLVNAMGEAHVGFSPGWLGDVKTAGSYVKTFTDWMQGFATIYVMKSGNFHYQIHSIVRDQTMFKGRLYQWQDRKISSTPDLLFY